MPLTIRSCPQTGHNPLRGLLYPATTVAGAIALIAASPDIASAAEFTSGDSEPDRVTSVDQLSDVQPTDWAFQALQSLVERYQCLGGYPKGPRPTAGHSAFQGHRALSRAEFARGLNACLRQVQPLLNSTREAAIQPADLETLKTLQAQFAAELVILGGRMNALELKGDRLAAQQFSPTVKLTGQTWFNLTAAIAQDAVQFEALPGAPADARFVGGRDPSGQPLVQRTDRAATTLSALTWLTLNTSFTGRDNLSVQLAAGNGLPPISQFVSAGFFNTYGNPYTEQTSGTVPGRMDVVVQDLFYSWPLNDAVKLTVGPQINWFSYFDLNRFTYFVNGAGSYVSGASPQSSPTFWGAGAVVEWNINPQWRLAAAYLGENIPYLSASSGYNTASSPNAGLFGGTYSATAELAYAPSAAMSMRLRYTHSRLQAYGGQVGGGNAAPLPYGYADAGPGYSIFDPITGTVTAGGLDAAYAHTFAFNFDWLVTPKFGLFGRYSYGNTNLQPIDQAINTQSFQVGAAFPDLGKPGALGVLTLVMPMDILQGRQYFASGSGNGGTIYELEASYFYPVTNNLAIVPSVYAIFNPNNFSDNPNIYVINLRTQFTF